MTKWLPLLCVAFAAQARAGVRIESEVTVNANKPVDSVLEIQGDRFRINLLDHASGDVLRSTIFDGARILQLKAKDKTYTVMTMADLKTETERLEQMKAAMPADARAQLDKGQTAAPVFTFTRAPGGETMAGIACENYSMTKDGKNGGLVCLAPWKRTGLVTKADMAPMRKLAEQVRSFGNHSIGDLTMGPDFDKWPGWPLGIAGPDGRRRTRVTKISRTTFPASNFEVPTDYSLKPTPMLGDGPHGHSP